MDLFVGGITISDADAAALRHDLIDIEAWVTEAIAGKINNAKKHILTEWEPKVFADVTVTTIPADKEGLIAYILARPDYKDRVEAEADWLAGR